MGAAIQVYSELRPFDTFFRFAQKYSGQTATFYIEDSVSKKSRFSEFRKKSVKDMKFIVKIVIGLALIPVDLTSIIIGSDTLVSRQTRASFPSADTNNTMLGFAMFEQGYRLQDKTTTCTFNDFFQVTDRANMRGGRLYVKQDLNFYNKSIMLHGGHFQGNFTAVEFLNQDEWGNARIVFPGQFSQGDCGELDSIQNMTLGEKVCSLDWSFGDQYMAAGLYNTGNSGAELNIFSFDGAVLTLTNNGSFDLGASCECARWHPTLNYLAVCRDNVVGDELEIYFRNNSNGTTTVTSGANLSNNATACAWHPSGNFLVVGSDNSAKKLILYSFSAGIVTQQQIVSTQNKTINHHAISWSPDGKYVAVGFDSSPDPELRVYYFDGSMLTSTLSSDVGHSVKTLDWNPTGTYIALGLDSSSDRVRMYRHLAYNGSLTEIISGKVCTSSTVYQVHWTNAGDCLAVTTAAGNNSRVQVYDFDKNQIKLTLFDELCANQAVLAVRWSRSNLFLVRGTDDNMLDLYTASADSGPSLKAPFVFHNIAVVFNSDVLTKVPFMFLGICRLDLRGRVFSMQDLGQITVRPNSQLTIQNACIKNVHNNTLRCITDTGLITFQNCQLALDRDFTFSRGSFIVQGDLTLSGTSKFIYTATKTSTISSYARLLVDQGITFSYSAGNGRKNLIEMIDNTSLFHFNGSTLFTTNTGLRLQKGSLLIENRTTFTSQARNTGEAIEFGSDLTVRILGDALLNVYGKVNSL